MKGVRFAGHRDAGAPATTARAHSAQGADEVALLDIDASREGREPDFAALAEVARETQVPLTYGGGVTSVEVVQRCFEHGADKVCLTGTALDRPELLGDIARRYGEQAVVVGIDVIGEAGRWRLYDHRSGRPLANPGLREWARTAVESGAGEIRLVSVEREGSRAGLDVDLWNEVRPHVPVPLILEGGAGTLQQLAEAMKQGVDSVGLGTMLVFSDNNLVKVRRYLGGAGIDVRP